MEQLVTKEIGALTAKKALQDQLVRKALEDIVVILVLKDLRDSRAMRVERVILAKKDTGVRMVKMGQLVKRATKD